MYISASVILMLKVIETYEVLLRCDISVVTF